MSDKVIVFANDPNSICELVSGARKFGSEVILITSATEACGANRVYTYPETDSVTLYLKSIAVLVSTLSPKLVLCEAGADGKLVAGALSVKLNVSPMSDAMSLEYVDGSFVAGRMVYGGAAVKTESCTEPAVVIPTGGVFEPCDADNIGEVMALNPDDTGLKLEGTQKATVSTVNLAAAKKVIGVGRGLSSADNIPHAEAISTAIGAEIGCTRPVAEEEHWYSKERYIGVSGCMLKPNFYMAIGISGQVQHMVGVNQASVIFAIDKNENAPIIGQSDYALIGDVNEVLPKLVEALKN